MIPLSILDLASIVQGGTASEALANTLDLARHAERLGFRRFWLAEHHSMTGIASAATSVVIAHVAAGTSTIRVGAGGVMLPNHAPLLIAEQFGTLAALHPGRIDLGLGRAPGSDPATSRALRRDPSAGDSFPQDVLELMHWFEPAAPGQTVQAVPGAGLDVPIWILGSSLFGAQLAAALGLPFAFASHFAPRLMQEAVSIYRSRFTPADRRDALTAPYVMLGVNVTAADTFPQDVLELMHWFEPASPGQTVLAVPGAGLDVPIWILGSSLFGAQLAAALGLPYAFASHFAPRQMYDAVALYRERFTPSGRPGALQKPYVMLGVNVIAADTDEEARWLFSSPQQMFVNVRRGHPGPLPPPRDGVLNELAPWERAGMEEMLAAAIVGGPQTVRRGVESFVERTGADELMVVAAIYDHAKRVRSFEVLMEATR